MASGQRRRRRARRRMLCVAGVGVLLAALVSAFVVELVSEGRLHAAQGQLEHTRTWLTRVSNQLDSIKTALRDENVELHARSVDSFEAAAALSAARGQLSAIESGLGLVNFAVGTLSTCVDGVQSANTALDAGDNTGALAPLQAAASSCELVLSSGNGGPVYPFDFADPDVLTVDGVYYAYGTNSANGSVQILESTDMVHWQAVGDALPHLARWADPHFTWAPAVIERGNQFLLYYAAAFPYSGAECISVAVSPDPEGPFVDSTTAPLECQLDQGGSIDPSPYVDSSGRMYLTWKSEGTQQAPATIWAQALDPAGTKMAAGEPTAILRASQPWEGSVVEAPAMVMHGGDYDLFYSGNDWDTAQYAVGVALCSGPLGPCTKPLSVPLLASGPGFAGPGGESVFVDDQGSLEIAFHAWLPGDVGYPNSRLMFIRQLTWLGALPQVAPG